MICLQQSFCSLADVDSRAVSFLKGNKISCHDDDIILAAYLNGHLELLVLFLELLGLLKTPGDREARDQHCLCVPNPPHHLKWILLDVYIFY